MNPFVLFAATDPTGGSNDFDPDVNLDVTGGGGSDSFQFFIASFVLALILIALGLLLARQLRRMNRNYREMVDSGEMPPDDVAPGSTGLVAANHSSAANDAAASDSAGANDSAAGHHGAATGAADGARSEESGGARHEDSSEQDDGWS